MITSSLGDMALAFQNNRANSEIKTTLERLTRELASGQRNRPATGVAGDFGPVAAIETSLRRLVGYATATNEAGMLSGTMQASLGLVQDHASSLSNPLLVVGNTASAQTIDAAASEAAQRFESTLSALNSQIGGKFLFAGRASDTAPLADAETILADLQTAIATAGATDAAGVIAAVDAWFDTPGSGFDTVGYLGSPNPRNDIRLSDGESAALEVTGADPRLRDTLKSMALGALIEDGVLQGVLDEQAIVLRTAGERLLTADNNLTTLRADVGLVEGQVEEARVRNEAEESALQRARNELLSADPYQTATELQETQSQLELLYTITARLSGLSLANYL